MELIDALSSTTNVRSVVELSLSPFFRRHYSSMHDAIACLFQPSETEQADEERRAFEQKWVRLIAPYLPEPQKRKVWLFGKDEFVQKLNTKLQARLSVQFSQTKRRGSKGLR